MMNKGTEAKSEPRSVIGWVAIVVAVLFIIALLVFVVMHMGKQAEHRKAVAERQALNAELGLPRDFPIEIVPVYSGLEIIETDRDSAESNLGEPLDYWFFHALIDEDKEPVYDFYHEHLMGLGMHQQTYAGIPTGYGADYADESYLINLTIETRGDGEGLHVEFKVYRVK